MPLDSVTVSALAEELRAELVGAKIDKVQQPERDTILLSLRGPGGNVRLAICGGVGNARVHITAASYENPAQPPMFCMLLPVVFSIRYYSFTLTLGIAAITTVVFAITTYWGAATQFTPVDLNLVEEGANYASDVMVYSFLPKWLIFVLIAGVCAQRAKCGRAMVFEQARISHEHSRVETELQTASQIQLHALPVASELTDGKDACFDLATSIIPAKEVGGDFYDFFYIDPTHLALVIADVSGKGIPAAMFMMRAETLIKSLVQTDEMSLDKIMYTVNNELCTNNDAQMFVTCWCGILDIKTGRVDFVNAGHNIPIVKRKRGKFEEIKVEKNFVLAGLENIPFRLESINLKPGDEIFIYTDGVTEATNKAKQLYGMNRLLRFMNGYKYRTSNDMIKGIMSQLDSFQKDAEQADDITMLMIRYKPR